MGHLKFIKELNLRYNSLDERSVRYPPLNTMNGPSD